MRCAVALANLRFAGISDPPAAAQSRGAALGRGIDIQIEFTNQPGKCEPGIAVDSDFRARLWAALRVRER
jgi:hypothetical protein